MIIKEKSIKSYKGLENALRYVLTKTMNDTEFIMTRFIRGDRPLQAIMEKAEQNTEELFIALEKRIDNMMTQYKDNDKKRERKRKNGVKFYHSILSFHKDDQLSNEQLLKVARTFSKKRFPNSLVTFVPHYDKDHLHLHGLASAVEHSTGKVRHLSRKEFSEVKQAMEQWQNVELGLKHSRINHSKKRVNALIKDAEYQLNLKGKLSEKQELNLKLAQVYNNAPSPEVFYKAVEKAGIKLYKRGKEYGIEGSKRNYRLKTLGYSSEKLQELQKTKQQKRLLEMQKMKKKREQNLDLGREK